MLICISLTDAPKYASGSYARANQSERVRLFNTGTPHDVASACLVAGLAPAQDYLAISADKAAAEPAEYLLSMRAMAASHSWAGIIDITGLPINEHLRREPGVRSSRLQLYRALRKSFELLRTTIGSSVPPDAVDELFLTCLDHPDSQLVSQVMPKAAVSYLPHGLGSIHASENETCLRWTARASLPRRMRHSLASVLKRSAWGPAATPPLSFDIAEAFSFYRPPAIGRRRHDLSHLMTPDVMERLFLSLPPDTRATYQSLKSDCDTGAGLLLMTPGDGIRRKGYPHDLELQGLAELAAMLVRDHGVDHIIVKPHPRNSSQWIAKATEVVQSTVTGTRVTAITRHSAVPAEIAVGAMNVVAAAGIGSTSVHTLARIYGIPTYSPDRLLRELHTSNARVASRIEKWIDDNRDFYKTA